VAAVAIAVLFSLLLPVAVIHLVGCGGFEPGVTPGGQQDVASARAAIEKGEVPDPDSITVQGFLSEHSIPIDPPADPGLLYVTATGAWNKDFDAFTPLATVQIGFGTTLDADSVVRGPLNLAIVIDTSGSMDDPIDLRTDASKLDAVLVAVDRLLGKLNAGDLVSVITFNSRTTLRAEAVAGNDALTIKEAIDGITPDGNTDLAAGITRGYSTLRRHSGDGRSDRVILFTDALPTAGARETDDFLRIMKNHAEDGFGVTVFGVGADFGDELAYEISQVRGGNYYFLSDYDRIVSVFDEEFDYLVTPIAYDVDLTVSVPFSMDIDEVYGIPEVDEISHVMELEVPTLFLSARQGGGAIFVRLRAGVLFDFEVENTIAEIEFSYTTLEGEKVTQESVSVTLPAGLDGSAEEAYFENDGIRRGVLLLNTALVLRHACEDAYLQYYHYYGGVGPYADRALERLTEFLPYFDALADGLEDKASASSRGLSEERALLETLLETIEEALGQQ
jgi:Ca-activated chloride channel family protein